VPPYEALQRASRWGRSGVDSSQPGPSRTTDSGREAQPLAATADSDSHGRPFNPLVPGSSPGRPTRKCADPLRNRARRRTGSRPTGYGVGTIRGRSRNDHAPTEAGACRISAAAVCDIATAAGAAGRSAQRRGHTCLSALPRRLRCRTRAVVCRSLLHLETRHADPVRAEPRASRDFHRRRRCIPRPGSRRWRGYVLVTGIGIRPLARAVDAIWTAPRSREGKGAPSYSPPRAAGSGGFVIPRCDGSPTRPTRGSRPSVLAPR